MLLNREDTRMTAKFFALPCRNSYSCSPHSDAVSSQVPPCRHKSQCSQKQEVSKALSPGGTKPIAYSTPVISRPTALDTGHATGASFPGDETSRYIAADPLHRI